MSETVYMKFDSRCKASAGKVCLGDIGSILCEDKAIQARVRAIRIMEMPKERRYRKIFSVLWIMEKIQQECPGVGIENVGESDFIVEFDGESKKQWGGVLKGILVGIVILFGSGFAIMTFNNDVGIPELFAKIYEWIPNGKKEAHPLEICYSLGLTVGIIVFYNHFGGVRFHRDPTPIEVQMRSYEAELDTAMIETAERSGMEQDVS